VNCLNPIISGITTDGGYAEVMIAEARALASIPDELTSAEAAPLLCAGITTYNALRNAGLRAGDLVGIQGIGGLGHLGVREMIRKIQSEDLSLEMYIRMPLALISATNLTT
jgi:propanol-preferring alcohol dehydrogenase